MATYYFTSTSSQDPLLGANWTKSDGTTGTAPTTGDDVYIQSIPGLSLANIWASGGVLSAPTGLSTSGASSTGGNLAQSTNYFYYVTATNANGESPVSAELSYTTPASGTATNQITVNWSAVSGATGYKIYRGTTTGGELYLASVGNVTSYADTTATVPAGPPPGKFTYNSLTISQTYTGTIGIAGIGGYWVAPSTTVTIGTPATDGTSASGSGRIKLDLGSIQTTVNVLATASIGTDTPAPPVLLKTNHSSSVVNVLSGLVGLAAGTPGETSTVNTINVEGSSAQAVCGSGVTWTTATCASSGKLTTNSGSSSGTLNASGGGQATCYGTAKIGTVTNSATVYYNVRPAAGNCIDTLNNLPGGTVDFSGNPATGTVGTFNPYPGSQVNVDASNSNHITFTTTSRQNVATVQYS